MPIFNSEGKPIQNGYVGKFNRAYREDD